MLLPSVLVAALLGGGAYIYLTSKTQINPELSSRAKEFIQENKHTEEFRKVSTESNPQEEVQGILSQTFQVDDCFKLTIPYKIIHQKHKGDCFYNFTAETPRASVVTYMSKINPGDKLEESPAVIMRRQKPEVYQEEVVTVGKYNYLTFKKIDGQTYEKSSFLITGGKLFVLNLICDTNENLDPKFSEILSSVEFL